MQMHNAKCKMQPAKWNGASAYVPFQHCPDRIIVNLVGIVLGTLCYFLIFYGTLWYFLALFMFWYCRLRKVTTAYHSLLQVTTG